MIVTPVSPNDLRQITVDADGAVEQTVLSQVRYSELEVKQPFLIHPAHMHLVDVQMLGPLFYYCFTPSQPFWV